MGTEPGRSLGTGPEGDPSLVAERLAFGTFRGVRMGRQVVAGQGAREFVGPEGLEESGRGEVADLSLGTSQRGIGDLADQGLDEGILAALGRPRVRLEFEDLASDEILESRSRARLGHDRRRRPDRRW